MLKASSLIRKRANMGAVDRWVRGAFFVALRFSRFDGESTLPPTAAHTYHRAVFCKG
jgi:hypothetical protein